jgi:hypothetical protein
MTDREKILDLLNSFGQIDGAHHKAWVIDQIARIILAERYIYWIAQYRENGEYEWDCGIAP